VRALEGLGAAARRVVDVLAAGSVGVEVVVDVDAVVLLEPLVGHVLVAVGGAVEDGVGRQRWPRRNLGGRFPDGSDEGELGENDEGVVSRVRGGLRSSPEGPQR
jgi:hypothetical protein